jgi:CelD/BcsL family acetyltransferase involved in cellulose biosynthesis
MTVVVEEFHDVAAVPSRFDPLFACHGRTSFFLTRDWFEVLSATGYDRGAGRLVMAASLEDGTPVALVPLGASRGTVCALANYYSMLYAPLLDPEQPRLVLTEALSAIAKRLRRRCSMVHLRPMAADDPALDVLDEAFSEAGFMVDRHESAPQRYLETTGLSAETFTETLNSRLRHTVERRFGDPREPDGFSMFTAPSEVEAGMKLYTAVYAASWKEPEPFASFMPALARTCARHGMLRLGCLQIEGDPAAAQFWIVHEGQATIYKLAHDPRYDDRSVGTALTLRMFQEILAVDRPHQIDFGLGDEPFKTDWTPDTAARIGWLAFNPASPRGLMRVARHRAGRVFHLSARRKRV